MYVFPTRVGMDHIRQRNGLTFRCIPHTRGDGPEAKATPKPQQMYSPHAWGWTIGAGNEGGYMGVFPTRVGMDQTIPCLFKGTVMYSPHAWGWTDECPLFRGEVHVFPTRVGMDQVIPPTQMPYKEYSPHAWGWTGDLS